MHALAGALSAAEMLEPWYPYDRTFGINSSLSLLRTNALEDYELGEVWMRELADDFHELFRMLQSVQTRA